VALASCVALVSACVAAMAAAPAMAAKQRPKFVFLKAKVIADGTLTPGHHETISVARMAPKAAIRVFIEAPPTTIQCGELYFCDPARAQPAPGSPPFRADAKGRATFTFVMPDTYFLETNPFDPKVRQPVTFADQQRVHIDVDGSSKTKRVRREAFGFARATVILSH